MLPGSRLPRARADDEIIAAGSDRLEELGDPPRIVRAVAVHEHQDICVVRGHCRRQARAAITASGVDHLGARLSRPHRGGIAAAAIGDDDAVNRGTWDFAHHGPDRPRFVQRRYDGDRAILRRPVPRIAVARKLHRSQAPAQTAMGTSGRRLIRQ